VNYHGKLVGPNGQVYMCEHNHRTLTAAITCANSSATRRMAAMAWDRAAAQAAQRAALAKQRAEARAAAEARRIAAQEAAAARRAAAQAAAEEARVAKRAAKLAAMPPRRAWKKMTPDERLLKIAEAELGVYGEIISPEAKAAYDARAAKSTSTRPPIPPVSGPPRAAMPPTAQTPAGVPAYLRALDLSLSPYERARAREEAEGDPEQWQKYVAALRAQQVERELARLKASTTRGSSLPARAVPAARPAALSARLPSEYVPRHSPVSPQTPPRLSGAVGGGASDALARGNVPLGMPAAAGFSGEGLFVVGLDITPGVYRTSGPAGGRNGSVALLKSTNTHDIADFSTVGGSITITVGPGVKAVQVRGCQPWSRLGDSLDEIIAAASQP
jgi:hypothetical protein